MVTDRVTYLKELENVSGLLTYTASELSPMSYVLLVTDIELTFGWRSVLSLWACLLPQAGNVLIGQSFIPLSWCCTS